MTNLTPDQIDAALKSGIINQEQAQSLLALYEKTAQSVIDKVAPINESEAKANSALIGNEEDMRFLRSFSDIFIAMGVAMVAFGVSALASLSGGGVVYLVGALIMAVLAEYFGRRKRQNAPTLITALAFLIFVQKGTLSLIPDIVPNMTAGGEITAAVITFLAMLGFYLRIRLPFCMALMGVALFYLAYAVFAALMPGVSAQFRGGFVFIAGLIFFAAALAYDMRDPARQTRFSDNAFWLHFIAAPLMVHGLLLQFVGLKTTLLYGFIPFISFERTDALIILLIVGFFTLIALAINRRIFMVSTLGYAGLSLAFLMHDTGLGIATIFALTLLFMGGAIIMLGVGWHKIRALLVGVLPRWRVFPPPQI